MPRSKFQSTALPTPEVVDLLKRFSLREEDIQGWFDYPSLVTVPVGLNKQQLSENSTDFEAVLLPFLDLEAFLGSINKIDLAIGCSKACGTCLAKAALLSRMFSTASLIRGFHNQKILDMLSPFELRIGNTSDPSDQPDLLEILKVILAQTAFLDERAKALGKRHNILVFTNYRPSPTSEATLNQLLDLAKENDRLLLTISLPLNKTDLVNDRFVTFSISRPDVFWEKEKYLGIQTYFRNISIHNVRTLTQIYSIGRMLPRAILDAKKNLSTIADTDRYIEYQDRGCVELLVNPEALWLMVYATIHESSTVRSYLPLNLHNYRVLTLLPWVNLRTTTTPPHWPGQTGVHLSRSEATLLMQSNHSPKQKVVITS